MGCGWASKRPSPYNGALRHPQREFTALCGIGFQPVTLRRGRPGKQAQAKARAKARAKAQAKAQAKAKAKVKGSK
jgi:hypothetical protein